MKPACQLGVDGHRPGRFLAGEEEELASAGDRIEDGAGEGLGEAAAGVVAHDDRGAFGGEADALDAPPDDAPGQHRGHHLEFGELGHYGDKAAAIACALERIMYT